MQTCPYCAARLNFFRVMRMTRWTPYKCPYCNQTSTVPRWQLAMIGGIGGGLGGAFATSNYGSVRMVEFITDYVGRGHACNARHDVLLPLYTVSRCKAVSLTTRETV